MEFLRAKGWRGVEKGREEKEGQRKKRRETNDLPVERTGSSFYRRPCSRDRDEGVGELARGIPVNAKKTDESRERLGQFASIRNASPVKLIDEIPKCVARDPENRDSRAI